MVCYGPRLGTIVLVCAAAYAFLHEVIARVLHIAGHIAGLAVQAALITCAAAAAVVLLIRAVRAIQRRRAAAGACTTCRFRCQQQLEARPQPRVAHAGHRQVVLLPIPSPTQPAASPQGRPLVLD